MKKKVAIIIVNWNGLKFLNDCLSAVYMQTYQNFDVYFVDNGSTDGSVNFVKDKFPKVKICELAKNTGFAYANNLGIKNAFLDKEIGYILTLNNDTKITDNFLENLVHTIEMNNEIGSIAPKVKFFYEENLIDSVGIVINADGGGMNRGFKEVDNGQYDKLEEVFGACAGAALYRRAALESVSYRNEYFDNSFFAYYEDLDLAWRLRLAGWKSVTCPEAIVFHVHSATAISHSPFKAYYVNRNRFFLILKDFPTRYSVMSFINTPQRYCKLFNSMFIKKSGPSYKLKEKSSLIKPFLVVLKGWCSFFVNIPQLLTKRHFIQKNLKTNINDVQKWFLTFGVDQDEMIYK